jgi:hypothetical protein
MRNDAGSGPLVCAECGMVAIPDARGWRAMLAVADEDAEDVEEVAVYCPECAERGFDKP